MHGGGYILQRQKVHSICTVREKSILLREAMLRLWDTLSDCCQTSLLLLPSSHYAPVRHFSPTIIINDVLLTFFLTSPSIRCHFIHFIRWWEMNEGTGTNTSSPAANTLFSIVLRPKYLALNHKNREQRASCPPLTMIHVCACRCPSETSSHYINKKTT